MVSFLGLAIVGIIFVAAFIAFGSQLSEIINGATTFAQATNVNNNLQINPTSGQQVCNLKIVFQPNLVAQSLLTPQLTAGIGVAGGAWQLQNGAQYTWTNCHAYGNPLQLSWIPFSWIGSPPTTIAPNDILISAGQTVHLNLVVISPTGGIRSYTTDPFCTQYCTSVTIPAGAIFVPKQYTFTFVITNLPRQNYQVQVTSELGFNGQNAGQPYNQNIQG